MSTLTALLTRHSPFLLLQSSASRSSLPILRWLLRSRSTQDHLVLISVLYPPSSLLPSTTERAPEVKSVSILDWTECVPEYSAKELSFDMRLAEACDAIAKSPAGSLTLAIDSADALHDDLESTVGTYKFFVTVFKTLIARKYASRLIVHLASSSPLLPHLISTSFSPSLIHLSAFPPALLTHIATAYLTPPPRSNSSSETPNSGSGKFWSLFIPMSSRSSEVDALVFGKSGEGGAGGGPRDEIVVDVLVRGRGTGLEAKEQGLGQGRKRRGVERSLEGWSAAKGGPCTLTDLEELKGVWGRVNLRDGPVQDVPDPTRNLTFNLNLTPAQQESKASVPLPYARTAESSDARKAGQILYDPDSADDIDDEDPDEDLDI